MAASKQELRTEIENELKSLASVVRSLDETELKSPSKCEGWTVAEVAGHIARFYEPFPALMWNLARWRVGLLNMNTFGERRNRHWAAKGPEELANLFESKVPFFAKLGAGSKIVLIELLVHQEDIRRAVNKPRDAAPNPETAWAAVEASFGQVGELKIDGTVKISVPDGPSAVLSAQNGKIQKDADSADVTVSGPPLELLHFLSGRESGVEITGKEDLVAAINQKPLHMRPFGTSPTPAS